MKQDEHNIPWPKYWRWTLDVGRCGCLQVLFLVFASTVCSIRHIPITLLWWVSMIAVIMLPWIILTIVNLCIRIVWWMRIGRIVTWKGVRRITGEYPHTYRLFVEELRPLSMSFGTYRQEGGWSSILLREEESGKMWVVFGQLPNRFVECDVKIIKICKH